MANVYSTTHNTKPTLIDAIDSLSEARCLAYFIQGTAINAPCKQSVTLTAQQLSGFGYAIQGVIDRVKDAEEIIEGMAAKTV